MDFGVAAEIGESTQTTLAIDRTVLPGLGHIDATIFAATPPASVVVMATPGGGMSRRYFDLDIEGYSMAVSYTHLTLPTIYSV